MTTPFWTIALVLIVAFLAAVGQLLFKLGAVVISSTVWSWILNWQLMLGLALHGAGFVLLVMALKHGNLSILYPVLATSYIWVAILSSRFLGELFTPIQWAGVALIIGGIGIPTSGRWESQRNFSHGHRPKCAVPIWPADPIRRGGLPFDSDAIATLQQARSSLVRGHASCVGTWSWPRGNWPATPRILSQLNELSQLNKLGEL